MSERKGHYMRTFSGLKYWPLDPRAEDVNITDIAHALANQCRFNGHTHNQRGATAYNDFYSVAEHSVLCSLQSADPKLAFELLMHDAAEAYTGDLIRPLKMIPEIRAVWTPIELQNEIVIAERFGLEMPFNLDVHAAIKKVDMMVCKAEMQQIMHGAEENDVALMEGSFTAANIQIELWTPAWAKRRFLERFGELYESA